MEKDSIAPTARWITRLIRSQAAKWIGSGLLSLAAVSFTYGIWPFFKGWAVTRAATNDVEKVSKRVSALEQKHVIEWERMQAAGADYLKLTHGEQVYWAIQNEQRSRERLVEAYRQIVMLTVELRTNGSGTTGREARKHARSVANDRFKDYIKNGTPAEEALAKTLDDVGLER